MTDRPPTVSMAGWTGGRPDAADLYARLGLLRSKPPSPGSVRLEDSPPRGSGQTDSCDGPQPQDLLPAPTSGRYVGTMPEASSDLYARLGLLRSKPPSPGSVRFEDSPPKGSGQTDSCDGPQPQDLLPVPTSGPSDTPVEQNTSMDIDSSMDISGDDMTPSLVGRDDFRGIWRQVSRANIDRELMPPPPPQRSFASITKHIPPALAHRPARVSLPPSDIATPDSRSSQASQQDNAGYITPASQNDATLLYDAISQLNNALTVHQGTLELTKDAEFNKALSDVAARVSLLQTPSKHTDIRLGTPSTGSNVRPREPYVGTPICKGINQILTAAPGSGRQKGWSASEDEECRRFIEEGLGRLDGPLRKVDERYEESLRACYSYIRSSNSSKLNADGGDTNAELNESSLQVVADVLMSHYGLDENSIVVDIGAAYNVAMTHIAQFAKCRVWGIEHVAPRAYLYAANFLEAAYDAKGKGTLENSRIAYVPANAFHFKTLGDATHAYVNDEAFPDHLVKETMSACFRTVSLQVVMSTKAGKYPEYDEIWLHHGFRRDCSIPVKKHGSGEVSHAIIYVRNSPPLMYPTNAWNRHLNGIFDEYLQPMWSGDPVQQKKCLEKLLHLSSRYMAFAKRRRSESKKLSDDEDGYGGNNPNWEYVYEWTRFDRGNPDPRCFTQPFRTREFTGCYHQPYHCSCLDCYRKLKHRTILVVAAVYYDVDTGVDPVGVLTNQLKKKKNRGLTAAIARDTVRCKVIERDAFCDYEVYTMAPKVVEAEITPRQDRHIKTRIGYPDMQELVAEKVKSAPVHFVVIDPVYMPRAFVATNFSGVAKGLHELWFGQMSDEFKCIVVPFHKDFLDLLCQESFEGVVRTAEYIQIFALDDEECMDPWNHAGFRLTDQQWETFGKERVTKSMCTKSEYGQLPQSYLKTTMDHYIDDIIAPFQWNKPHCLWLSVGRDEGCCGGGGEMNLVEIESNKFLFGRGRCPFDETHLQWGYDPLLKVYPPAKPWNSGKD